VVEIELKADGPTHSLELEFILPENILQAIAYVDTFYVDSATTPADSQKRSASLLSRSYDSPETSCQVQERRLSLISCRIPWRRSLPSFLRWTCVPRAEHPFPPTRHPNRPYQRKHPQVGRRPLRLQKHQYLTVCVILISRPVRFCTQ
jgi:hypothetical protein